MWAKAAAVGNAEALSTVGAGVRQRIVHMSTALAHAAATVLGALPARRLSLSR